MEYEVEGLLRKAELLGAVLLGLVEDGRSQLDVARLVNAVYVAEGGCDGEVLADLDEALICVSDISRAGIECGLILVGVVNAVFLAAGAAELELEGHAHLAHSLEVGAAEINVVLQGLDGKVDHVGGEQRNSVILVVSLAGVKKAVDPGKELLCAVVGVDHGCNAVVLCYVVHVEGHGDGAEYLSLLSGKIKSLACEELRAAVGDLADDCGVGLLGSLEDCVAGVGADAVYCRKSEAVL